MTAKKAINEIRRMLVNNDLIKRNGRPYSEKTISCYNVILKNILEIADDFDMDYARIKEVNLWINKIRKKLRDRGNESVTENTYIGCIKWTFGKISEVFGHEITMKGPSWAKLPDEHQMIVPEYRRVIKMIRSFTPRTKLQEKAFRYVKTAALTGARYSDMSTWTRERNIIDGFLVYTPKKTGGKVIRVPLSDHLTFEETNLLPKIPYTTLLKEVKNIFRLSGFTRDVIREREVGGEKVFETVKEWEIMGLHRLRASAITGMLQNGMTETEVKSFSGHSMDSKSFKRYVDLDKKHLENRYNLFLGNI